MCNSDRTTCDNADEIEENPASTSNHFGNIRTVVIGYALFKPHFEKMRIKASLDVLIANPAFPKPDDLLPARLDRPDEKKLSDELAEPRNMTLCISGQSGSGKSTNVCRLLVRGTFSFYGSLRPLHESTPVIYLSWRKLPQLPEQNATSAFTETSRVRFSHQVCAILTSSARSGGRQFGFLDKRQWRANGSRQVRIKTPRQAHTYTRRRTGTCRGPADCGTPTVIIRMHRVVYGV